MHDAPSHGPIPFLTLPNWVAAAGQCGFNIEPIFRAAGIELDLIHIERVTVRPQQIMQVMEGCVAQARGRHFPFVLGETFAFDYLPEITTFLSTSPTLREALRVFDWVRELINPMIDIRLEEREAVAWLVLDSVDAKTEPNAYFVESTFAAILKFARILIPEPARFERLCLRFPPPAYAAEFESFFDTEILFGQPDYALVFDLALLDRPLEGAFPALHEQAEYLVRQRLDRLPRRSGLLRSIETAFTASPELLYGGLERLSKTLGIHARTLQRRLQEEGESYAQVQARARFRLAAAWLEEGAVDLETISERLGFSDRRSFTRAFTRWAGVSPSAFRLSRSVPSRRGRS